VRWFIFFDPRPSAAEGFSPTPPRAHWIGPEFHGFGEGCAFKLATGVCIGSTPLHSNAHPCITNAGVCVGCICTPPSIVAMHILPIISMHTPVGSFDAHPCWLIQCTPLLVVSMHTPVGSFNAHPLQKNEMHTWPLQTTRKSTDCTALDQQGKHRWNHGNNWECNNPEKTKKKNISIKIQCKNLSQKKLGKQELRGKMNLNLLKTKEGHVGRIHTKTLLHRCRA